MRLPARFLLTTCWWTPSSARGLTERHAAPRELIVAANQPASPIISLDVPSGLDADTGVAAGEAIRAAATLTLALPKIGLLRPAASDFIGQLYLGDISVPAGLYERLGLSVPQVFSEGSLVKIVAGA